MIPQPVYTISEPHLSGFRVVLGYETLADAQAAHSSLAQPAPQPVAGEDEVERLREALEQALRLLDLWDVCRSEMSGHGTVEGETRDFIRQQRAALRKQGGEASTRPADVDGGV